MGVKSDQKNAQQDGNNQSGHFDWPKQLSFLSPHYNAKLASLSLLLWLTDARQLRNLLRLTCA